MSTFTREGRLGELLIRGGKASTDLAAAVTSGSVQLSSTEVTQLSLTVTDDPDFTLLDSRLFDAGTPVKAGSRCDYADLHLEVRAIEVAPRGAEPSLSITARSYGVGRLRRAKGGLVRKKLSPTQFAKLEAARAGLRFVGQPSATRQAVARQGGKKSPESSWDTLQRLASELGFVCFEAAGTLYFAKPTWLIDRTGELRVTWKGAATDDAIDALPVCRRSGDDKRAAATIDVTLRGRLGDEARPGMCLVLAGVPTFEGRYMVETVTIPLGDGTGVKVTASTPVNPKPQPPPKKAPKTSPGPGRAPATTATPSAPGAPAPAGTTPTAPVPAAGGSGSAAAFVSVALAQAGKTYIFGAEASLSDPSPNAFDCSELIEWAAGRVGVSFVDGSSAQIAACIPLTVAAAIATRGALLWTPGHIGISLGNGQTIEAANPGSGVVSYGAAGRFQRGGKIPGMRY